jgi:outer membrane protein assembly factor BamB
MYQADARHTGHLPLYLRPDQAALRWQRAIGSGLPLNPVAAGDGKVLVSLRTYFQDIPTLFSVDAATGQTLWSKAFGDVFSVNPPSYAYGMVYLQTGQDGSPPFLHAFDATTGEEVFEETFEAQWERYYAPTVEDGKVYIDGGYYGGMYRFDAFSGEPDWFLGVLPQYDQWTPAISQGLAYSYVGEYEPGLYVADAADGGLVAYIPDPQFQWDGWSMNEAPVVAGGRDVLAVHDGRLILFDTGNRSIRWQKERNFTGQPSVARHAVYAVDAGHLAVLDKETGADLWSWQPPEGALIGRMIVTDSHVLASTAANVYAIDVRTRQSVWSYPAGGDLALAEGTLYVASSSGLLTAITMPDVAPSALISLEITGPSPVVENSSATFHALAHYGDGSVADRTLVSSWSIEPATYADIGAGGVMTTRELLQPSQDAVVRARYMENGQTIEGMLTVRLVVGVSIPEFVRRSLTESVAIKRQLVHALDEALTRERAALAAASPPPGGSQLPEAIAREEAVRAEIRATIALLRAALATLGPP